MHKVCAIILKDKKFLMVRNVGRDIYTSPGGKIEENETRRECLKRELEEELGVSTKNIKFFADFEDKAIFHGNIPLKLSFFIADVDGPIEIKDSELEELRWINSNYENENVKVTKSIRTLIVPKLLEEGLIE
jgi:8-oxo-dGTP pyrophosphatase MutT (NUDIX family)